MEIPSDLSVSELSVKNSKTNFDLSRTLRTIYKKVDKIEDGVHEFPQLNVSGVTTFKFDVSDTEFDVETVKINESADIALNVKEKKTLLQETESKDLTVQGVFSLNGYTFNFSAVDVFTITKSSDNSTVFDSSSIATAISNVLVEDLYDSTSNFKDLSTLKTTFPTIKYKLDVFLGNDGSILTLSNLSTDTFNLLFNTCKAHITVDFSNLNITNINANSFQNMFVSNKRSITVDMSGLTNPTLNNASPSDRFGSFSSMFKSNKGPISLDMSGLTTPTLVADSFIDMFVRNEGPISLDMSSFNPTVTIVNKAFQYMFKENEGPISLDMSGLIAPSIEGFAFIWMFTSNEGPITLDMSSFNPSGIIVANTFRNMFNLTKERITLDMSSFSPTGTIASRAFTIMFNANEGPISLDMSGLTTPTLDEESFSGMFNENKGPISLDMRSFNPTTVDIDAFKEMFISFSDSIDNTGQIINIDLRALRNNKDALEKMLTNYYLNPASHTIDETTTQPTFNLVQFSNDGKFTIEKTYYNSIHGTLIDGEELTSITDNDNYKYALELFQRQFEIQSVNHDMYVSGSLSTNFSPPDLLLIPTVPSGVPSVNFSKNDAKHALNVYLSSNVTLDPASSYQFSGELITSVYSGAYANFNGPLYVDFSKLNITNINANAFTSMFKSNKGPITLDMSGLTAPSIEGYAFIWMFNSNSGPITLDMSSFNPSGTIVKNQLSYLFYLTKERITLDMSSFNPTGDIVAYAFSQMFKENEGPISLDMSSFNPTGDIVANAFVNMFFSNEGPISLDMSSFNPTGTIHADAFKAMFMSIDNTGKTINIDLRALRNSSNKDALEKMLTNYYTYDLGHSYVETLTQPTFNLVQFSNDGRFTIEKTYYSSGVNPDGTLIGTTSDGNALELSPDGTDYKYALELFKEKFDLSAAALKQENATQVLSLKTQENVESSVFEVSSVQTHGNVESSATQVLSIEIQGNIEI